MRRPHGSTSETGSATETESSPRYHVAPRGLLFFYALMRIGKKPMSGYDLMVEIGEKTDGAWRPGPGAVYPTLQKMARLGYIKAQKKARSGPRQVSYEITSAGLRNIANAKRSMGSSGERLRMMSSLFIDLMDPDDLVRFALNSFEVQPGVVRAIVESEKSGLSNEDRLFVLRQYKLNLDREMERASASISALEKSKRVGTGPPTTRRRK